MQSLFDAAQPAHPPVSPEIETLVSGAHKIAQDDPSWPTVAFLVGEIDRQRGHTESARAAYSELASWAISNPTRGPYDDTWGGSGLAALGLWRWLQILDERGPAKPDEVARALSVAAKLQATRLYSGMVRSGLLPGLPLMAEDVAHRLARVAWKQGLQDQARSLYLDFLDIDSRGELDDIDRQIQAQLIEGGSGTRQRFDLLRARRLLALVKTPSQRSEAAQTLKRLSDDQQAPADVRAEAGYEWANSHREWKGKELEPVLNEVIKIADHRPVAAQALYRRGMSLGGQSLVRDLVKLRREFPESALAADALFQVAAEYLFTPDLKDALPRYQELRDLRAPNDFQDSAYYLPALGLFGRGGGDDLAAADRLLAEYLDRYPEGAFRLRSLFWRGRIAERKNDQAGAQHFFQQVIAEAPYDYYALRAHLHLEEGIRAIRSDLPAGDSRTRAGLSLAHRKSWVDSVLTGRTPYHRRLQAAARSGLYGRLLDTERAQSAHGRRLDDISLADLDAQGLTSAVALLLALRQDALAAKDSDPTPDNWLRLAGLLGHQLRDWPTALEVTSVSATAGHGQLTALQAEPRYLATVYPSPADLPWREAVSRAAWTDAHGSTHLSQSLMYALMRQESHFYPAAISPVGAAGLLQIMPGTLEGVDPDSKLLSATARVAYLFDPQRNVTTWALLWKTEFARDRLYVAIAKHNAGSKNVKKWTYWAHMGASDDLEYRVETVRFPQTRNFLRAVLADTAIFDAAGLFEGRLGG